MAPFPLTSTLSKRPPGVAIWALAMLAATVIPVVTATWGIGFTADSASYLMAARNLARHQGFCVSDGEKLEHLTHFPPLYPALLALPAVAGVDPAVGARWIHGLLFAALVGVAAWFLRESCGRTIGTGAAAIAGLIVLVTSFNTLQAYGFLWSESLFLPLCLVALIFLARYARSARARDFCVAALAMGAACLTRYVAVTLPATGFACLLLWGIGTWGQRIVRATALGAVGAMPLLLWLAWNRHVAHDYTNRHAYWTPTPWASVRQTLTTLTTWLVPPLAPPRIWWINLTGLMIVVGGAGLALALRKRRHEAATLATDASVLPERRLPPGVERFSLVFAAAYVALAALAAWSFDPLVVLDDRTLLPVQVVVLLIVTGMTARALAARGSVALRRAAAAAAAVVILSNLAWGAVWAGWKFTNGIGFVSRKWMASGIVDRVNTLADDAVVISNFPQAVYCTTGRPAISLPPQETQEPAKALALLSEKLARGGLIIYFNDVRAGTTISTAQIEQLLSPAAVEHKSNGTVYLFPRR